VETKDRNEASVDVVKGTTEEAMVEDVSVLEYQEARDGEYATVGVVVVVEVVKALGRFVPMVKDGKSPMSCDKAEEDEAEGYGVCN